MSKMQQQFISMSDIRNKFVLHPIENKNSISTHKIKSILRKSDPSKKSKGGAREFIAKLSKGLMLPITMLPIAGLFLGIGSAVVNNAGSNEALTVFGQVMQMPGQVVFDNLAILFCIAVAISFSNESGVAGLCAFMGWIVFTALHSAFIIQHGSGADATYNFWWYKFDAEEYSRIFGLNVGITSLNTSIFGGIIIGYLTATLYNKFKNIQMPPALGFFSGVRFVPIATFLGCLVAAFLFCAVWPGIGLGIYWMGWGLSNVPLGINTLFFGYINRALVPNGLHHAFNAPFYFTSAGGTIAIQNNPEAWTRLLDYLHASTISVNGIEVNSWFDMVKQMRNLNTEEAIKQFQWTYNGDLNCFAFANTIAGHSMTVDGVDMNLTFDMISKSFETDIGQYQKGAFPIMIFALPAAAAAMVVAAPKGEGRGTAFSAVLGSALASAITGITEPIEFTFLFLSPALYYGFHAVGMGVSYWAMSFTPCCVGYTFSAGLIDYSIYGILPDAIGAGSNCYWVLVVGAGMGVAYFFGFWWIIKKWDIKTPGREGGLNRLMTKKDVLVDQSPKTTKNEVITGSDLYDVSKLSNEELQAWEIICAYGGIDNIVNVDACITKLRIQVASPDIVDDKRLVALGALGVTHPSPQSVYAVFGAKADYWKNLIKEVITKVSKKARVYTE